MTSQIVEKYARSFFDLAKDLPNIKEIVKTISALQKIITDNAEFRSFLKSPLLKTEDKKNVFQDILTILKADQLVTQFIYLLLENNRIAFLEKILKSFLTFFHSADGKVVAQVYTSVNLQEGQSLKLKRKLSALLNKDIEIESKVTPDLLGGIVIQVGSQFLDGSVRADLLALNKQMKGC